ncbi:MAG: SUMF1/EgtB/PvdO family nonheme iron enzyme [Pseudomonas marincola]
MSKFKKQIEQAQARQRLFLLGTIAVITMVGLLAAMSVFLLKGTVIEIRPSDAYQNGQVTVVEGFAIYVDGSLLSLSRAPAVEVTSQGFKPLQRVITTAEEGKTAIFELDPLPSKLVAATNMPKHDMTWFLNGGQVAIAPTLEMELEHGDYELKADHKYFEPQTLTLSLERGKTTKQLIELTPVTGTLSLTAVQEGATVTIDGEAVTSLPLTQSRMGGAYAVRIEKRSYLTITDTIQITNIKPNISRHYRLVYKPASVTVKVFPAGGDLTLNGKPIKAATEISLSPKKRYFLKYSKKGFGSFEKTIRLSPGENIQVALELELQLGDVNLYSKPEAAVFIDGKAVGNTPLKLRLPAYKHSVSFLKKGYRTETRTILPSTSSPKAVNITLQTEAAARISSAKLRYKNTIGQDMILFKPNAIELGAPRSEKGQRANEFLRKVELTKHFYISKTEVTQAQYAAFKPQNGPSSLPVTNVSWMEAAVYCNWLSVLENLEPFYKFNGKRLTGLRKSANGYRMPSEAEWEWLARKANRRHQTQFTWGNKGIIPEKSGNIADETARGKTRFYVPNYVDGFAASAPVASYPKETSGLHDMFGNVSEWVTDFYSLVPPRKGSVIKDPLGPNDGDQHVVKGANWASGSLSEIRPAYRAPGSEGSDKIGFRIARYL